MGGRQVYLVPGYFGSRRIGAFDDLGDRLSAMLADLDVPARVVACPVPAADTLAGRARALTEYVEAAGGLEADEIHFVGHCTGGLDARLVLSPSGDQNLGVRGRAADRIARRTRSLISVSSPHRGLPLARLATTGAQRRLARAMLSATAVLGPGWPSLRALVDGAALRQLTPDAMEHFDATTPDHPGVRYACVLAARPPGLSGGAALLWALHGLAGADADRRLAPALAPDVESCLAAGLEQPISGRFGDGIVPLASQVHGQVVEMVPADHFETLLPAADEPAPRGADGPCERAWSAIACTIAGACEPACRPWPVVGLDDQPVPPTLSESVG